MSEELLAVAETALASAKMYRAMLEAADGEWVPYSERTIALDMMLPRYEELAKLAKEECESHGK